MEHYLNDLAVWAASREPVMVAQPKDVEEVQRIVRWANERGEPLIPVSSGIHFYGATIPDNGGLIVDLSKMKSIEVNQQSRCINIEPGVRWGPLQMEANKYGLRVLNPLLPHAESSALTSILEREPPLVWKSEYGERIIALEVVLPNGDIFRTGSWAVKQSAFELGHVVPYGPGLNWHWLFQGAQGTLGIITRMRIRAYPIPSLQRLLFITSSNLEEIIEATYTLGKMMVGYECFILNNLYLASILVASNENLGKIREKLPAWVLLICLSATRWFPKEKISYEEEAIAERGIEAKLTLPELPEANKVLLPLLLRIWEKEPYWRFRWKGRNQPFPFITSLSMLQKHLDTLHEISLMRNYPFEDIGIYVQPLEYGRAAYCELGFHYDPDGDKEKSIVKELIFDACTRLAKEGAFFNRPYGPMANLIDASYKKLLRQVKSIFDPNNIMNPGKVV
ncbi:MAG: FAD-binding oxidoreductase [Candidatus Bathyarchaeia archaeon]